MPILTERKTWAKPRPQSETRRHSDLTPDEIANIKTALRFLRKRLGGVDNLAVALKTRPNTIEKMCARRGKPSAGLAIRVARVARASVEDVLSGGFPPVGACPHCGRNG